MGGAADRGAVSYALAEKGKTFVPGYDEDKAYPAFGDPAEVTRHFKAASGVA